MNAIQYFWEVPGFWKAVAAMVLFAAAATLAICAGPGEATEPQQQPGLTTLDATAIHAWELTKAEWDAITPEGRAFYRNNITKAPRFTEAIQ